MPTSKQNAQLVCSLSLLMLSPMMAHLTWRPVAAGIGGPTEGLAYTVSWAAVAVAGLSAGSSLGLSGGEGRLARGAALGIAAAVGLGIAGAAGAVSLLGVAAATSWLLPRMVGSLEDAPELAETPTWRPGMVLWCVVVLACVARSADLAAYLGDPAADTRGIAVGGVLHRHLCLSAYLHAAELVRAGTDNVYDLSLVPGVGTAELPASAAHMAPFQLDRYGYPPQFLLLPLALVAVVHDFAAQRALWTCLNALLLGAVLWKVAVWVGPRSGRVARVLSPMLWLLGGITYQSGNIQLSVLALGLLAMIAFDERRERDGGALLAGVTLAKIAPGMLGVLLLVQRRWRGVGWTAAVAVVVSGVAIGVLGTGPFVAFVEYHLPRIASGEAYDFLDDSRRVVFTNLSPFGIPFKLAAMGVAVEPWRWGPRFATGYTVVAFLMTLFVGRRSLDRRAHAAAWMSVLTMAALRSPMGPGYLLAGVFWALALVGSEVKTWRGWAVGGVLFVSMMLTTAFAPVVMGVALAGQAVMHGVIFWLLVRRWPVLDEALQPHRLGQGCRGTPTPTGTGTSAS